MDKEVKQSAAQKYVHKDHASWSCDRSEMIYWMGRRVDALAWAIFDVLTEEQQAAVLAQFGWKKVDGAMGWARK